MYSAETEPGEEKKVKIQDEGGENCGESVEREKKENKT